MQQGSGDTVLWHTVLISFRDAATDAVRREVHQRYQTLGEDCGGRDAGILFWKVDWNLDQRKNVHLAEFAIFRDDAALQAFRAHPRHRAITDILLEVADWQVGDLLVPGSLLFRSNP
jgi:hypothetical protein